MGELSTIHIIIKNDGALPCKYELIDPRTGLLVGNQAPYQRASTRKTANDTKKRGIEDGNAAAAARLAADDAEAAAGEEGGREEKKFWSGANAGKSSDGNGKILENSANMHNRGSDSGLRSDLAVMVEEEQKRCAAEEAALKEDAAEVAVKALQYPEGRGALYYESVGEIGK
jgi:hypothetical protein